MRVQRIISNSGYCSRRKAEELIEAGRVIVNGKLAQIGDSADPNAKITIDGEKLTKQEKTYLAVYKPKGVVSSLEDPFEKTLGEYLPEDIRVYPAGRLDKDADGLLICTNDGELANKIMHPRYSIYKTYIVMTYSKVPREAISIINRYGVEIKEGFITDINLEKIAATVYRIKLHVGYHKVVKKIFDKFGIRVKQLTRTSIGPVSLGKLRGWRPLTQKELKLLQSAKITVRKKGDLEGFISAFEEYRRTEKKIFQEQQIHRTLKQRFERNSEDKVELNRNPQEVSKDRFERKSYESKEKRFQKENTREDRIQPKYTKRFSNKKNKFF